jgi:putative hydrolase of the HAD superfamily
MAGAGDALKFLHQRGVVLGIESNCQPYTLLEMDEALSSVGLAMDIFEPRLRFLSFENGFSKPDPYVFRLLGARLRLLGIRPGEALVVGDHKVNDIAAARAQGFQTWHLTDKNPGPHAGPWSVLHRHLAGMLG